ncbi:MAG: hypothetical protein IT463_12915 [Planctomycetes bacterium]|nr:hypothetical protein [Planctomycetota bacterium]
MTKKLGLIVLLLGVAIVVGALVDVFGMSSGFNLNVGVTQFSEWPKERLGLLAVGVLLGVWGAYSLSRPGKKKK